MPNAFLCSEPDHVQAAGGCGQAKRCIVRGHPTERHSFSALVWPRTTPQQDGRVDVRNQRLPCRSSNNKLTMSPCNRSGGGKGTRLNFGVFGAGRAYAERRLFIGHASVVISTTL